MAYKRITLMDIGDIIRRWHDGQSVSRISACSSQEMPRFKNFQNSKKPDAWHFPVQPLVELSLTAENTATSLL